MIKSNHKPTMKTLITKQHFISRLVEKFNGPSKDIGYRGHILVIFNFLRLTSESQHPDEYIPQVLSSSDDYKAFTETLEYDMRNYSLMKGKRH